MVVSFGMQWRPQRRGLLTEYASLLLVSPNTVDLQPGDRTEQTAMGDDCGLHLSQDDGLLLTPTPAASACRGARINKYNSGHTALGAMGQQRDSKLSALCALSFEHCKQQQIILYR